MILREETIGDCRLLLGDCLSIMPLLDEFDAVVTDPPYGLGKTSGTIGKSLGHKRNYATYEDTHENLISKVIPAVKLALEKSQGRGIVTPGSAHAFDYPKPTVTGCFYQPASVGMCLWGRVGYQPILYYGRDPRLGKTIQPTVYNLTEPPSEKRHPCSKPMKAWEWVVNRASLAGENVLDPFLGSGTTLVACAKMGRKGTGIEMDPEYFDIACERVRKAYEQPDFFVEQEKAPEPTQEALL